MKDSETIHSKLLLNLRNHLRAYGAIIFVPDPRAGALLLALGFIQPNVALGGLLAVAALFLFGSMIRLPKAQLARPGIIYNPLLVGMSIGALFKLDPTVCFFTCAASIFTFVVTIGLEHFLAPTGTPVLSLPFAIVSMLIYLGAWKFTNFFTFYYYDFSMFTGIESHLPLLLKSLLKACGTIVFMPNVISGAIILTIMLFHSRIMVFWGVTAFLIGIYIHGSTLGSIDMALLNPYSFNYLLVGLALGGTFLLSSLRSGIVIMVGVSVAIILVSGSSRIADLFRIPVFTLPFNGAMIPFIMALKLAGLREALFQQRETPEDSITHTTYQNRRFKIGEPSIALPFIGEMSIMQGFDGELTHTGKWRHGIDLFITDSQGCSHIGAGTSTDQYLAYGKQVLSPVSGYVVALRNDLPDNILGHLDHINNWGNYVIIHSTEGHYVEMSHFLQNSITLWNNQWINVGDPVGLIGNSGYSLQPHLHVQMQETGYLGDNTIPFNFSCYQSQEKIRFSSIPIKDEKIKSLDISYDLLRILSFILGTVHPFTWDNGRGKTIDFQIQVARTQDTLGLFYLDDGMGGYLYFTIKHGFFHYYDFYGSDKSPLRHFMTALPRMPLSETADIPWNDTLPLDAVFTGFKRGALQFAAGLSVPVNITGTWAFDAKSREVRGSIPVPGARIETSVKFDSEMGFSEIRVGRECITRRKIRV
ncbi:MAG: hypothetical protein CVV64_16125 [Candidatus Wallbacteria bacterium HGW-Wallbacteria-1]|jgi:urea transporter|uniref:M23ase beta-sheet core domain-containing protein n=1 Tax=Candidatus Wallbacteria bacterium HGW-Wallbacteria-1 TaxID=2013854 RepID=A0A2N1PL41_9BACT|nr:MAG: hypothetical protein CVV64_16125 [Candidatus Wallbacteria bacterium HGW-Wallbacteria-1]